MVLPHNIHYVVWESVVVWCGYIIWDAVHVLSSLLNFACMKMRNFKNTSSHRR